MIADWYCKLEGVTSGPFDLDELRFLVARGRLSAEDKVRRGAGGDWLAAASIPGLFAAARQRAAPTTLEHSRSPFGANDHPIIEPGKSTAEPVKKDERRPAEPIPAPRSPTPPPPARQTTARNRKRITLGTAIGAGAMLLILLLLLLCLAGPGGGQGSGVSRSGTGSGEGSGSGSGADSGSGRGAGVGQGGDPTRDAPSAPVAPATSQAKPGSSGDDPTATEPRRGGEGSGEPAEAASSGEETPEEDPSPQAMFSIHRLATTSASSPAGEDGDRSGEGGGGTDVGQFFGVKATGRRFVYIVDCSGSMDERGGMPFAKACQELISSVSRLNSRQSFYVMFFDDFSRPMFFPRPAEGSLLRATRKNVDRLRAWTSTVVGGGGTNPRDSLLAALDLEPDAIFLLTDGQFHPGTVVEVTQRNQGRVMINTVGFMQRAGEPLLQEIARQNRGEYKFVP